MLLSKKNGMPADIQRVIFAGKQLENEKRLSEYGLEHGSTVFLVLRLPGGSGIPHENQLDDAVELSDAPDMITWDDDPENKRAKMSCGHAISKLLSHPVSRYRILHNLDFHGFLVLLQPVALARVD